MFSTALSEMTLSHHVNSYLQDDISPYPDGNNVRRGSHQRTSSSDYTGDGVRSCMQLDSESMTMHHLDDVDSGGPFLVGIDIFAGSFRVGVGSAPAVDAPDRIQKTIQRCRNVPEVPGDDLDQRIGGSAISL